MLTITKTKNINHLASLSSGLSIFFRLRSSLFAASSLKRSSWNKDHHHHYGHNIEEQEVSILKLCKFCTSLPFPKEMSCGSICEFVTMLLPLKLSSPPLSVPSAAPLHSYSTLSIKWSLWKKTQISKCTLTLIGIHSTQKKTLGENISDYCGLFFRSSM